MSNWPFRFLHAADFHLETTPFRIEDVPEHLAELMLESPYRAAQRVFDTALAENVDFVVLSGDLLHARHTGPRGPLFLAGQFQRLADRGIAVYWVGGRVDPPESWPPSIRLPDNVQRFPRTHPETMVHRRADTPLARLIGASRPSEGRMRLDRFVPEQAGLFTIAVAHGPASLAALRASRVDYWALGGRHLRRTLCEAMPVVHDPGTPQGRQPDETGPRGCTLVDVDASRNVRLASINTDALRWSYQSLSLDEGATRESLEREMRQRIESLKLESPETTLLISWQLAGAGDLGVRLRRGALGRELLAGLREEHGRTTPAAWSVALVVEPPGHHPAAWYEEDTLRGEFLRQLRHLEQSADEPLRLETCLKAPPAEATLRELVANVPEAARAALLREAAMLGVDLLAGEDHES